MESHTIVEDFNVFEDRRPTLRSGSIPLEIHLLGFEGIKKRFGHRIVVAIARATHALDEAPFLQLDSKGRAGILATAIRVKDHPPSGLGALTRHSQGLLYQRFGEIRLHRPADNLSRKQIHDDTQIQPPLVRPDIRDIRHPGLVGKGRVEILRQQIGRHPRRGIGARRRLENLGHFGSNPVYFHQTGYPIVPTDLPRRLQRLSDPRAPISLSATLVHGVDLFNQRFIGLLPTTFRPTTPGVVAAG